MSVFFKLFGLRYSNPAGTPNLNDQEYLSSLQFARNGDVLIDEDGNSIAFGAVGVAYGAPTPPEAMVPEETMFWYNLATSSIWSRTKLSDGVTVIDSDLGPNAVADMLKSVYDTNNDGIVDAADQLKAGAVSVTATAARNHLDDATIHRAMNDAVTTTTTLWSSQKTSDVATRLYSTTQTGGVNSPTALQAAGEYYLRADNSWHLVTAGAGSFATLTDVDLQATEVGQLVMQGSDGKWVNVELLTGGTMTATFDPTYRTLTLVASGGSSSSGATSLAELDDVGTVTYTPGNMLLTNGSLFQTRQMSGAVTMDYLGVTTLADVAWSKASKTGSVLNDIGDVDTVDAVVGNLMAFDGTKWVNVELLTSGGILASYDPTYNTLTLSVDTAHNNLSGLQGGTAAQYYHLTSAQHTIVTQAATNLVSGYLSSTDWATFNGKMANVTPGTAGNLLVSTGSAWASVAFGSQSVPGPIANQTAVGAMETLTVGESVVFGNLLYIKSDGKWWKASGSAATTVPGTRLALATASADAACLCLAKGRVRNDSWTWTVGKLLWANTTSGGITETALTGTGEQRQVIGQAHSATGIKFNPSLDIAGVL